MDIVLLLGRILFSAIFIMSGFSHFKQRTAMVPYVKSKGLPAPELMILVTGAMILVGGLSVLLGFYARLGGWLIAFFLIPTAIIMHRFWGLPDKQQAQNEQAHFMKDMALAGGALIVAYFGSGPYSLAGY